MRKTGKKDCISLKNNQNILDLDIFNNQLLTHKSSSLTTLFLKFKTQKASPKRVSHLTIKNKSVNKDNYCNKKLIKDNYQIVKVISKNISALNKNKKNFSNNKSYETQNIKFRNQLTQNNRYTPKSFEHIIPINLIKRDDEINNKNKININMEKYKSTNLINIKKNNNNQNDVNNLEKKIRKKIKIIRANDSYNRNLKNNTLKDYIINHNSSNRSHTNCITRINSNKKYDSINLSSNHLYSIHNREDLYNKLNIINNNNYKKLINQTTPVTMNISRNFSSKKKLSNNQSFRFNKNKTSMKEGKKSLILTSNNSKILKKIQNKKSSFLAINQNFKFIKTNNYDDNKNKLLYNNEIKVLKPIKKKKKIIIINKNKNNLSKYNNSSNNTTKYNETKTALPLKKGEKNNLNYENMQKIFTESKESFIYKITNNYNIIDKINNNNKNNIRKKKSNNSIQKKQINKNKTSTNNKNIIQISEKQTSQKSQARKLLIKKFFNVKKNSNGNIVKNNAFINKINKINKKSSERLINIFPHIKKNFKDKKYTLTCNSRIITSKINLVNNSFAHAINKNKTRIEDKSKNKINKINKIIHIDIDDKKNEKEKENENIITNTIDLIKDNNINNINNINQNINNYPNKSLYYSEESQKLSQYIKDYYNLSDEYPSSNLRFYKFGRVIGKGAFGKVNIGLHILTGRIVAIKSFNKTTFKDEKYRNKIMNEIELMKNLRHFSVVRILDVIENEKYILLVMENVLGGDLLTFIKKRNKLPEKTAKFIFKQLLQSLKYIHSKNIVHRDIKLDNILIDLNNNIKLCDFGVGKYLSNNNEMLFDQCGTPAYIAPEVLAGEGYLGFPVDIWSSGVVLYSLLMGSIPFKAHNLNELQGLIMSGNFQQINGISKNGNDLLNKLLEINPKKRITIDDALNHPWFCDNINDNNNVNYKASLFTKAELILLSKNSVDYRNCSNEDIIENFTLQNLDTNKFNENKNIKTRSFIFAPFNTSFNFNDNINNNNSDIKSIIADNLEDGVSIQNNIILFDQDTNALNRQYELNNNIEIDHGVIINNSNEINNKTENDKKELNENDDICNNNNNSHDKYKINTENEDYNNDLYLNVVKNEFKIEKESDNLIKINNQKISGDSNRNKLNNINSILT